MQGLSSAPTLLRCFCTKVLSNTAPCEGDISAKRILVFLHPVDTMEMPVMRTRTSLACADVDLETATGKAYSHTEDKSKTPVEYLKKVSTTVMF